MSELYYFFPILFFLQLSWLGILAGILTAKDHYNLESGLLTKKNLLITSIQFSASGGVISLMNCGQFANAIIQTFGFIFWFTISLKMARQRIKQALTAKALIKWFIIFLAVIWLWQFLILFNYASMEWFMIFFILHAALLIITTVYKFLLKKRGAEKPKLRNANIGIAFCMYLFYVQITSFATAIAFDCGI